MNIAFFDSGIGGLTVLYQAMQVLPNESFIYFADSKNIPYGTKSNEEIRILVLDAVEFLSQFELKALVLACNTATSVVVDELREHYNFPIIGMEPAVKPATDSSSGKVLVCATERTLKEEKLDYLIHNLDAKDRVVKCSLQELVRYAENFDFQNPEIDIYLNKKFENIEWNEYGSIVLGCTHFLFFKDFFQKILPDHISILDGNQGTVNRLLALIKKGTSSSMNEVKYYISKEESHPIYFDHYLRYFNEIL